EVPNRQSPWLQFLLLGVMLASFSGSQAKCQSFARPLDDRDRLLSQRQTRHQAHKVRHLLIVADIGRSATQTEEPVAGPQTSLISGRILEHTSDQTALRFLRVLEQRLHVNSQPASLHLA